MPRVAFLLLSLIHTYFYEIFRILHCQFSFEEVEELSQEHNVLHEVAPLFIHVLKRHLRNILNSIV